MNREIEADVPDSIRPYLNEIAERLWAERAAVMVGAGFSKNAGDGFPDWSQLGDLFYQKAHGVRPDPAKQKYLNVLRLAEEVQASIGRPALENLLRSNIPDLTVEPSSLHVELLELPWVDVFTTNYDTLLERGSAEVVTRRYEPVVNKEDIPYAVKPRIVKLHGSFPSERPFIITEEDYRRYPNEYAPFVNTVQQALLENTFCLIGFSGDDPNFLQWIGWIRDNLGRDKAQKIYLVGVFDLSAARLQLLAQRGIIVVDLSCCHGIEKHDHKKALSRFLDYVQSKKPDTLDWPNSSQATRPSQDANQIEKISSITEEWRNQRRVYPGWLILPHGNREELWRLTQPWVNFIPDSEESPPALYILYAFELVWRLERCLLPVFDNLAEFCEDLLKKYWPFPTEEPPASCLFWAGDEKFQDLPWDGIRQAWLNIALSILRFYREEGHLEKWIEAENKFNALFDHLSAGQKEFLNYEGLLFSLFVLDLPNAKQRLENWRPNESQPYWMAKRASVLAELGLLTEAETLVREALENIRKKLNQNVSTSDLTLVSLESNAMLLAKYIQGAAALQRNEWGVLQNKNEQFKYRWNELKRSKCDPWNELELFELTLDGPPIQKKDVTEKQEFDIGQVTKTHHLNVTDQEALNAYAFLRFCEDIGLPFRIGNYTMATKTAEASLQRISRYSFFWATATLARLGNTKAVDNLFSRKSVYGFTENEADQLIQNYLDALIKCRDEIRMGNAFRKDNYGVRLAQLLPEVISRLCCKCSIEAKYRVFDFIADIYASSGKNNYGSVRNLNKRLIKSLSEVEQYSLIPKLLKVPFPEDLNPIAKGEFLNPFLLLDIGQKPECDLPDLTIQPETIENLLKLAELDDAARRRWAISSLVTLHKLGLLNSDQNQKFAAALWSKADKYRLPDNTDFYKFAFLPLPHPEGIDPRERFKAYVRATPFPIQRKKEDKGIDITGGDIPIVREVIGANSVDAIIWTKEDAIEFLERCLEWWDADKENLKDTSAGLVPISEEFSSRFARIAELIAEVVGPKLDVDSPDDIKATLDRLLKEMRENGLLVLEAEAACLHIYPDQRSDVYKRISAALVSNEDKIAKDGIKAIAKIILSDVDATTTSLASEPVLMLSQYITWRPAYSLSQALWIVVRILRNSPIHFSTVLENATHKCLDRLLSETAYDNSDSILTFDEKVEVRRAAATLAATLWKCYQSSGSTAPHIIDKWREMCLSPDEFSEIRNAWKNCEDS